jgi:hypothetical protein
MMCDNITIKVCSNARSFIKGCKDARRQFFFLAHPALRKIIAPFCAIIAFFRGKANVGAPK